MVGRLGIGNGIGIPFRNRISGGGVVLPPELKEALVGVWIADQNTNDSPTRNIIKNKIPNRGGDFEILNASYKDNSGYGLYKFDWSTWASDTGAAYGIKITKSYNKVTYDGVLAKGTNLYYRATRDVTKFKIRLSNADCNITVLYKTEDSSSAYKVAYSKYGALEHNIEVPASELINITMSGFSKDSITIEQIPEFNGAFVTDGVDDLIVSQNKTLEIIGENQPCTVVSMIGFIGGNNTYFNNAVGTTMMSKNRIVTKDIMMGIFGYTADSVGSGTKVVKNILGDENNYNSTDESASAPVDRRFSVEGYLRDGAILNVAEIAWYWTIIAKRILTTDEINQVIAYYNLDKYVTPDVYYDVKKQGLTNENHAEFGDKLIDYSGNSKDMQLYNIGWKLDSGVGKYEEDFNIWTVHNKSYIYRDSDSLKILDVRGINPSNYIMWRNNDTNNAFNVIVKGIPTGGVLLYSYKTDGQTTTSRIRITENNIIYELPSSLVHPSGHGFIISGAQLEDWVGLTITQIPSFEGALVTDGVEDYGKVEGLPIYKDYTVVAERAWIYRSFNNGSLVSKSLSVNNGAFIIEQSFNPDSGNLATYSFGVAGGAPANNVNEKSIVAQSKYKYISDKSYDLVAGSGIDVDSMTLATVREKDTRFSKLALWMLMSFPYSLSEFLIERQLKKRKLGSLYPETNNK